jgi:hypothetical protein
VPFAGQTKSKADNPLSRIAKGVCCRRALTLLLFCQAETVLPYNGFELRTFTADNWLSSFVGGHESDQRCAVLALKPPASRRQRRPEL